MGMPLMSPNDAHKMAPNRFSALTQVLGNKKALDMAFMQHAWEMQRQASDQAAAQKRTETAAGNHGQSGSSGTSNQPHMKAAAYATSIMKDSMIKPGSEEYQAAWVKAFNMALEHMQGGGDGADAMAAGGGGPQGPVGNPAGAPFEPTRPSTFVNPLSKDRENSVAAQWQKKRAALKTSKSSSSQGSSPKGKDGYPEGTTIVNPSTGERMKFQGGKWVPI